MPKSKPYRISFCLLFANWRRTRRADFHQYSSTKAKKKEDKSGASEMEAIGKCSGWLAGAERIKSTNNPSENWLPILRAPRKEGNRLRSIKLVNTFFFFSFFFVRISNRLPPKKYEPIPILHTHPRVSISSKVFFLLLLSAPFNHYYCWRLSDDEPASYSSFRIQQRQHFKRIPRVPAGLVVAQIRKDVRGSLFTGS